MDTNEISLIFAKALKNSHTKFLGVFPSDHIPCISDIAKQAPCAYILNTDPCTEPGTHWVAFYHPSPSILEFFDSFGRSPSFYGFSVPSTMHLLYNTRSFQSQNSLLCGQYCIMFIHNRSLGKSLQGILRRLDSLTPLKSDQLVLSYVNSLSDRMKKQ